MGGSLFAVLTDLVLYARTLPIRFLEHDLPRSMIYGGDGRDTGLHAWRDAIKWRTPTIPAKRVWSTRSPASSYSAGNVRAEAEIAQEKVENTGDLPGTTVEDTSFLVVLSRQLRSGK